MTTGYKITSLIFLGLLIFVFLLCYYGWMLTTDQQQIASARSGSMGMRIYTGGGPGSGK